MADMEQKNGIGVSSFTDELQDVDSESDNDNGDDNSASPPTKKRSQVRQLTRAQTQYPSVFPLTKIENGGNFLSQSTREKTHKLYEEHKKCRDELSDFLKEMKSEHKHLEEELEYENEHHISPRFLVRQPSVQWNRVTRYTDKPLQSVFERESDIICNMCQKGMHPFKHVWYPCRICNRVFHKECIINCGAIHDAIKMTIDRAETNIGWSCHKCADLSSLLTDEEMRTLIDDFDSCDMNRDSSVSLVEFLAYKQKLNSEPITDDDKHRYTFEFKLTDLDQDNTLDWWEFVNHECKRMIVKRDQNQLVELLTEKEVIEAKALFQTLDQNGDGQITETEAVQGYKNWFRRFEKKKQSEPGLIARDSTELDLHASSAAQLVMDSDSDEKGSVSWEDFLAGQACYIICSRPNNANVIGH